MTWWVRNHHPRATNKPWMKFGHFWKGNTILREKTTITMIYLITYELVGVSILQVDGVNFGDDQTRTNEMLRPNSWALGWVWSAVYICPFRKKKKKNILKKKRDTPWIFSDFLNPRREVDGSDEFSLKKREWWSGSSRKKKSRIKTHSLKGKHFAPENRRLGPKRKVQDRLKTTTFQGIGLLVSGRVNPLSPKRCDSKFTNRFGRMF